MDNLLKFSLNEVDDVSAHLGLITQLSHKFTLLQDLKRISFDF